MFYLRWSSLFVAFISCSVVASSPQPHRDNTPAPTTELSDCSIIKKIIGKSPWQCVALALATGVAVLAIYIYQNAPETTILCDKINPKDYEIVVETMKKTSNVVINYSFKKKNDNPSGRDGSPASPTFMKAGEFLTLKRNDPHAVELLEKLSLSFYTQWKKNELYDGCTLVADLSSPENKLSFSITGKTVALEDADDIYMKGNYEKIRQKPPKGRKELFKNAFDGYINGLKKKYEIEDETLSEMALSITSCSGNTLLVIPGGNFTTLTDLVDPNYEDGKRNKEGKKSAYSVLHKAQLKSFWFTIIDMINQYPATNQLLFNVGATHADQTVPHLHARLRCSKLPDKCQMIAYGTLDETKFLSPKEYISEKEAPQDYMA